MMTQAVSYSLNRWGGDIAFYVDSTYFKRDGQIGRFDITMSAYFWEELLEAFPGVLFLPENSPHGPAHVKFVSTNNNTFFTNPQWAVKRMYEGVFSAVHLNGNYVGNSGGMAAARLGMEQGDIPLLTVNAIGAEAAQVKADLATALNTMRTITMTDRGQTRTFRSNPGAAFTYPLTGRVYFASTADGLAASTTWCERKGGDRCYLNGVLQDTAALDLSALGYYQIRYYDYAGGLVSNPGTYATIQ